MLQKTDMFKLDRTNTFEVVHLVMSKRFLAKRIRDTQCLVMGRH